MTITSGKKHKGSFHHTDPGSVRVSVVNTELTMFKVTKNTFWQVPLFAGQISPLQSQCQYENLVTSNTVMEK